jgi:hypothetical protein
MSIPFLQGNRNVTGNAQHGFSGIFLPIVEAVPKLKKG